jgi:hypothetical protein
LFYAPICFDSLALVRASRRGNYSEHVSVFGIASKGEHGSFCF